MEAVETHPTPRERSADERTTWMNGERKLAMFMDFENIARGVKEAQYKQFELKLVLERLLEKGKIIFYDDLIRDTKKTRLLHALPEKKAEAMAQLIDAIQALQRENKETLWGSMVKQTMIRKNPAFNESYYGYSTFSKLLEEAAKQKIVTLERDEKSGTYIITALSEEGRAA